MKTEQKVKEVNIIDCCFTKNVDDKFIRTVEIRGKEIIAFIDPGATTCIMKASLALKLGLTMIPEKTLLKTFGEFLVNSPGHVIEVMNFENLTPQKLLFKIVPDGSQNTNFILEKRLQKLSIYHTRVWVIC